MNDEAEWGTKTLGVAAAVKSLGALYQRTDKTDPRNMVFYFTTPKDKSGIVSLLGALRFNFEDVERDYTNGRLKVDAKAFYQALQDLKSIIHSK